MKIDHADLSLTLYHLSHDLRNTFGSNRRMLEILLESNADVLDEHALKWFSMVQKQSDHAILKLKRLSEYAKLFKRPLSCQQFPLSTLMNNATRLSQQNSKAKILKKNIKNTIKNTDFVYCDDGLLEVAFSEIINNVFEHNENSLLTITYQKQNSFHRVNFINTNFVSDKHDLGDWLRPFTNVNNSQDRVGLGLNIARQVSALHAGTMDIDVIEGDKLQISFSLPEKKD